MNGQTQALGQCPKCQSPTPYSMTVCETCGARLPWADALDADRRQRIAAQQAAHSAQQEAVQAQQQAARVTQQAQRQATQATTQQASARASTAPTTGQGVSGWAWIGILLFLFFGHLGCNALLSQSPEDEQKGHEERLLIGAYVAGEESIRNQLKAPSTAQFAGYANSTVTKIGPSDTFQVSSYVDAQNSFGAMLRAHWTATATYANGEWQTRAHLDEQTLN